MGSEGRSGKSTGRCTVVMAKGAAARIAPPGTHRCRWGIYAADIRKATVLQKIQVHEDRGRSATFEAGRILKECVIVALAFRMADTEQYFVVDRSIARSTSSGLTPSP